MSAPLRTEADVVRTLRSGTYTIEELYRLCAVRADTARDGGLEPVDRDRHASDVRWKRRVRGVLQQLRRKGLARRIERSVWVIEGSVAEPRRMLLVSAASAREFELRLQCAFELLSTLEEPCDLVLADPPYGLGLGGEGARGASAYARDARRVIPGYRDVEPSRYEEFTHDWVEAAARALRPAGQLAVVTGPQRAAVVQVAAERAGLTWVSSIAARKQFALRTLRRPACAHWTITVMTRGRLDDPRRVFNPPADLPRSNIGGDYPLDIWLENGRADRPGQLRNETELPFRLVRRIVVALTDPGELVVDPFVGGGNSCEACFEEQRRFIGADLNPNALRLTAARLLAERAWPGEARPRLFAPGQAA